MRFTMDYGSINVMLTAVRKAPTEKSEMINQLLFGEKIIIHKAINSWLYVESVLDGSTGWIKNSFESISDMQIQHGKDDQLIIVPRLNWITNVQNEEDIIFLVPGAELVPGKKNREEIRIDNKSYRINTPINKEDFTCDRQHIRETAISFINAPYLWGGRSIFGIDSSGLVQVLFKIHGIHLPRFAGQQVTMGANISFIEDAKPGDLMFFDDENGEIDHVGIITDKGRVIHASGSVRVDTVDHQGIYREDKGEYSHQLRTIKNILD
jgi:hypothetical protein